MTNNLRRLIWSAVLILIFNQILEFESSLENLKYEFVKINKSQISEINEISSFDWNSIENEAFSAQEEWLQRIPSVEQTGIFRAKTMESLGALCNQYKAMCRIAAQGEVIDLNSDSSQSEKIEGLVYSNFKMTVPTDFESLDTFMNLIENKDELRVINKLVMRGAFIDLYIRCYGILMDEKNKIIAQVPKIVKSEN